MVNVRKRKGNHCRGVAMVEAALVMPILLLVTFGAIKYGWLFLKAQQITNAARNGARTAALPDMDISNGGEVENMIIALLAKGSIDANDQDIDITVYALPEEEGEMDVVKVNIAIPSHKVDIMNVPLFPKVGTIRASVTMAREG